jgi:predicted nucleic acid-binding protein
MSRFLPDTTVMIAAICGWHEHNHRAVRALEARLARGDILLAAAPALIETYAVLTRLPPPHRLAPSDAATLVQANFANGVETVALDAAGYRRLLQDAPHERIAGGRIYDRVIAACAMVAEAATLLTFNTRDFAPFALGGMKVLAPEED